MVGSDAPRCLRSHALKRATNCGSAGSLPRGGPAHADLDEVPAKEPGAEDSVVVATSSYGARTSTGSQMLAERHQINVVQPARAQHDMAEVSCRAISPPSRAIACRRRETVEVRPLGPLRRCQTSCESRSNASVVTARWQARGGGVRRRRKKREKEGRSYRR